MASFTWQLTSLSLYMFQDKYLAGTYGTLPLSPVSLHLTLHTGVSWGFFSLPQPHTYCLRLHRPTAHQPDRVYKQMFSSRASCWWKKWPLLPMSLSLPTEAAGLSAILKISTPYVSSGEAMGRLPNPFEWKPANCLESLNNLFPQSSSLCQRWAQTCLHEQLSWQIWGVRNPRKRSSKGDLGVIISVSVTAGSRGRYRVTDWNCRLFRKNVGSWCTQLVTKPCFGVWDTGWATIQNRMIN